MESNKKLLAIISFVLVIVCLLTAIISDFVIFSNVITTILGGIIISVIAFVIMLIGFVASIILIFGVYLIKSYGFWPIKAAFSLFKEILNDIEITASQVEAFKTVRIIIIVICLIAMIIAIVAMHKDEMIPGKVPLKGMSKTAMILAIIGIVIGLGMFLIVSML